jgi:ribosome recycling factor
MLDEICSEAKEQMENSIEALKKQLSQIRTGRANTALLDSVRVDYYGSATPLNQVASVTIPDARSLMVKPWEKNIIKEVERAILEANLGVTPSSDGEVIRINIPPLTEERRREIAKQAKGKVEDGKVSVRNARRDANDMLKAAKGEGEISEDDEKRGLKMVQELTDTFVAKVDELYANKEKEIMEI